MSEGEDLSSRIPRARSRLTEPNNSNPNSNTQPVTKCSKLTVVLRKRESVSPNRIHQLFGPRKEMAVTEGHVKGQETGGQEDVHRQELSSVSYCRYNVLSSGTASTSSDVCAKSKTRQCVEPSLGSVISPAEVSATSKTGPLLGPAVRPFDICRKPRTRHCDAEKSGYNFRSVKQQFEIWSQSSAAQSIDHKSSGYRGRPVNRSCINSVSKRSQSTSSSRSSPSSVRSAPSSPGIVTSLYDSNPDLSGTHAIHYSSMLRRASESSNAFSVFKNLSSSDIPNASRSVQSSSTGSSPRFLVPECSLSVKAAVAHFSKPPVVSRSDKFRNSGPQSAHNITRNPSYMEQDFRSPTHCYETNAMNTVFSHSLEDKPDAFQQTSSHNAQNKQTLSLDNWLQSVIQTKEMGKEVHNQGDSQQKQDLNVFDKCGELRDQNVDLWPQGKGLGPEVTRTTNHKHILKDSTGQVCKSVKSAQGFTHGYDDVTHEIHSGMYLDKLTSSPKSLMDICNFQSVGSNMEPPVTICVTQDPDDVETQCLSMSDANTHLEEELNMQHIPLSPRSSFGSVCSFKSSNADSAVDMNNPDEEPSDSVIDNKISPNQNRRRLSKHSRTSDSEPLSLDMCPSPSVLAPDVPKVLVSDHSGPTLSQSPITVQAEIQQTQWLDKDLERIPRPWSPEDSAYFGNSDLSLDDTDEEEPPPLPKRKQSSWKIIRSIVRWSPFVQVFKKNKYPWIQLAGHQGNFQAGESGAVLKKLDSREKQCYLKLMSDKLKPFVPEYRGDTEKCGDKYIQLQDLLCEFNTPCVMDIKMGCRTYLEEELEKARSKPTLRKDMYKKMIEVDPNAPSPEEKEKEGVTKARYLQWRDEMSSSVNLGFRIEGIKKSDGTSSKDFKKTKTRDHIHEKLKSFIGENKNAVSQYIERLKAITIAQEGSEFFQRHEIISSSLLFVHDSEKASVWMIDFGKTEPLPSSVEIDHRSEWSEGNHEDGYLAGLDRLISIFTDLLNES